MSTKRSKINWKELEQPILEAIQNFKSQGVKPTLRSIYYALVSQNLIPNTRASYKQLSKVVVRLRKENVISWEDIEDRSREILGYSPDYGFSGYEIDSWVESTKDDIKNFDIEQEITSLVKRWKPSFNFGRWWKQPNRVILWCEKDALAPTIEKWCRDLKVKVVVGKGYSSWTQLYNVGQLVNELLAKHEKVIILYLGDLDPSGVDIERHVKNGLQYFVEDISRIEVIRIAVLPEHVEAYGLPPKPEDLETKKKLARDTRSKKYTIPYVVELDALLAYATQEFKQLVRSSIEKWFDKDVYEKNKERAKELKEKANRIEQELLKEARRVIFEKLKEQLGGET